MQLFNVILSATSDAALVCRGLSFCSCGILIIVLRMIFLVLISGRIKAELNGMEISIDQEGR